MRLMILHHETRYEQAAVAWRLGLLYPLEPRMFTEPSLELVDRVIKTARSFGQCNQLIGYLNWVGVDKAAVHFEEENVFGLGLVIGKTPKPRLVATEDVGEASFQIGRQFSSIPRVASLLRGHTEPVAGPIFIYRVASYFVPSGSAARLASPARIANNHGRPLVSANKLTHASLLYCNWFYKQPAVSHLRVFN